MLTVRIIPCLDVDNGKVVKGVKFKNIEDAGNPVELAELYNNQGADEIIFLDIGATPKSRNTLLDIVSEISKKMFIPLTVGGGIRTIEDIRNALRAGADKVSICSAALKRPFLISEAAERFGSQCIVLSIDAKKVGDSWHAYMNGGRKDSGKNAIRWAITGEALGAGEILLNSIDKDGTKEGYDIPLTRKITESVSIPVIASGGAGELSHISRAIKEGNPEAVLLASLLHYRELSVSRIKEHLSSKGIAVRW